MAVAFDTATTDTLDNATSNTFSHTCNGNDRLLIVTIAEWRGDSTSQVSSIKYDGVSLTKLDQAFNTALASLWYLVNPASGANNVVVISTASDKVAVAISMTGADTGDPFGTLVKDEASNLTPSVTLTSAVDELCIDVLAILGSSTHTVSGGQDERGHVNAQNAHDVSSTEPGAAGVTMSYTVVGDTRHAMMGVPVQVAPPSVAVGQRLLRGVGG